MFALNFVESDKISRFWEVNEEKLFAGKKDAYHCFGYDKNGIYIRDSSGWDTRYLTWSRLYGEVGFSGWVVGAS